MTSLPSAAVLPSSVTKRLVLAKYQLARARLQLLEQTEFSAWQAGVALHDAAEICLLAIADFCHVPRGTKSKPIFLQHYPALIEKTTQKAFHDAAAMEDVVDVRNPAKHRGTFPGVSDVRALCDRVESALDQNCATYLGIRLSDVRLADMIEDVDVRTLVKASEGHIADGLYTDAIVGLKRAWLVAIPRFRDRLPEAALASPAVALAPTASEDARSTVRNLAQWWEGVQAKLELLMLGVDILRHAAFQGLGPIVYLTEGGKPIVKLTGEEKVLHTPESAHFCLTFVLDTIVRLQETERVRQPGSYYVIRVKSETPFIDVRASKDAVVGTLPSGAVIDRARFGLGPWPTDAWVWEDVQAKRTFAIPFDAAEVVRMISRADHDRELRENLMKRRPQ